MSSSNPRSARAPKGLPAPSLRSRPRKALLPAAALQLLLLAMLFPAHPARATVPPYAEEWLLPSSPEDVEVDPFGRVWVSCGDDSVRVFTPTGGHLLFAFGGRGTDDGQFLTPYGIAFDPSGNSYICDYEGARVEMFTSAGVFLLSWPIPSVRADHVALDTAGDVYVTGYTDTSVHKFTSTGDPILSWPSDGGGTTSGVVELAGTIYVVQHSAPTVEEFATDGTFLGSFDAATLNATDIEVDAADQIWIADYNANMVRIYLPDGSPIDSFGSSGSGPGEFLGTIGIAIGPDGSVYVADELNGRIQRFGDTAAAAPPALEADAADAARLAIRSIAPNPSRGAVQLNFSVPRECEVRLAVLDLSGRKVATLADRLMSAGTHSIGWTARAQDGRPLAAGVYLVQIAHGSELDVTRMTIVR